MRRELREGDRVLTVSAFLITKEVPRPRALLLKHAKLGRWLQPGGHVERDQDPIMALIEECEVEVGIDVEPYLRPLSTFGNVDVLRLPAHLTSIKIPAGKPNPGDPEHYMIDMGYLIYIPEPLPVKPGIEAVWIDKTELRKYDMPEDVRFFLKHHL